MIRLLLCGALSWAGCAAARAETGPSEAEQIAAGRYAADVLHFDEFMAGGALAEPDARRILQLALAFLSAGKDPAALEAAQRRGVVELDQHTDDASWLAVMREAYWPRELASVKRQNVPELTEELAIIVRQPGIVAHDDRHVVTASALDGLDASNKLVAGMAGLPDAPSYPPERRRALQAELAHMSAAEVDRIALGATRHERLAARIRSDAAFAFLVKGRVSANVHAADDVAAEARYLEDLAAGP